MRLVDVPITAAELMLEDPGYIVSPVTDFLRDRRISPLKADESLSGGAVYLLISVSRVNGKVSESEMAVIESLCGSRRAKRRSSKVRPVVTEIAGECRDNSVKLLRELGSDIEPLNFRIKQWRPALEPIYEGI